MKTTLDKLPVNKIGIIEKINSNDNIKRRLLDLGMVKGTIIKPLYKSPLKDPIAYLMRGSIIALRNTDAKDIYVRQECDSND